MGKKKEEVIEKGSFGVTREEVEEKLHQAYEEKVQYIKMIDTLEGAIQTMEYILNGPVEFTDDFSGDKDKGE